MARGCGSEDADTLDKLRDIDAPDELRDIDAPDELREIVGVRGLRVELVGVRRRRDNGGRTAFPSS